MSAYKLRTLGDLSLLDAAGNGVKLRTRKDLLILACLAAEPGQRLTRDRLAVLLWPDRGEEQARNSLRTALSGIRAVLGADALESSGDHLVLSSAIVKSDIAGLRRRADGEERDDGAPLSDFHGGEFLAGEDLDGGDGWLAARRAEFPDMAFAILSRRIDKLHAAGEFARAVADARDLLSLDPFREESHRRLMRLYAENGERSRAIAQFRNCRAILRAELDVEPSAETSALADEIALSGQSPAAALHRLSADAAAESRTRNMAGPSPAADSSIAVLPFTNLSGDAEQDFLAAGIAEDIVTDLSRVPDLSVTSTGSTAVYRNAVVRPDEVAAQLGVRYLLEGSLRRSAETIRVTAKLVEGSSNRLLWAERYDRAMIEMFELQSEIAESVASALQLRLSSAAEGAMGARGTASVEAHEHYLRGRAYLKEMTRRSVDLSRRSFGNAIALDPAYALAHAGMAESLTMLGFHYQLADAELDEAAAYGHKALQLDPGLAEAHCSLGRYHSIFLRHDEADAAFLRAIEIAPGLQEAHVYRGGMYMNLGRHEEGCGCFRRAYEIDPRDLHTCMMLLSSLEATGRSDEARAIAREVHALTRTRIGLNPYDDRAVYVGAMALVALGDTAEARRWAGTAAAFEIDDPRTTYNIACLFGLLGERDDAIRFLERTLSLGVSTHKMAWMRDQDPDFSAMRDDPAFRSVFEAASRT